jgi:eukaryotic-like serine/threonine-protein kinase
MSDTGDIDPTPRGDSRPRPRRRFVTVALIVLVALVLGGLAYLLVPTSSGTSVPNVTGQALGVASSNINASALKVRGVIYVLSTTYAIGTVVGTKPAVGVSVESGGGVTLYVSKGPTLVVPNVIGMTRLRATFVIEAKLLSPVAATIFNCPSNLPIGTVFAQSPAPGTSVRPESQVGFRLCARGRP